MQQVPPTATLYKKTKVFTPENLPDVFANRHNTKAGVWGEIHVLEGVLTLSTYDGAPDVELSQGQVAAFAPQQDHAVAFPTGEGAFQIWFYADGG